MDIVTEARPEEAVTFLKEKLTRQDPVLGEIFRYWDRLRDGRPMPRRSDIDPRVIQNALGHAIILDRARPGTIRMRVAGTHLNELMGMEVRGMPVRALFELTDRPRLMATLEQAFVEPSIVELDIESETEGRMPLKGRMIVLPMTDPQGDVNKGLAALVTDGVIGQAPRRFSVVRERATPIVRREMGNEPEIVPGFSESQTRFVPADAQPKDSRLKPSHVPWLKVVTS